MTMIPYSHGVVRDSAMEGVKSRYLDHLLANTPKNRPVQYRPALVNELISTVAYGHLMDILPIMALDCCRARKNADF
jgi:hypothetical protein